MGVFDSPRDGTRADSPTARLRPDDLVDALARFVHRVHTSAPVDGVDTSSATPSDYLVLAAERVESGAVTSDSFDEPYRPHAPERLLSIATDLADGLGAVASVPVHGSLALADLRIDGGSVVGWTVPATPRLGDSYVDLSFLARDLAAAIGPAAVPALFDAYGAERPDPVRIEFWVTLRQLLP